MRWLLIAALASCYSPPAYAPCGMTCTTAVGCPGGLQCLDGVCRTETPCAGDAADTDANDPTGDTDGDTIPNAIDLCPKVASPNNNDHDGDMRGDICDPCPHLPTDLATNPDADPDGDGVGDGCDPRSGMAGDRIVAFHGFYAAGEITGWPNTGTWNVQNGELRVNAIDAGRHDIQSPQTYGPNVTAIAGIDVIALKSNTTTDRYAGVLARYQDSINYQACHTREQVANLDVRNRLVVNTTTQDANAPFTTTTLGPHMYTFTLREQESFCRLEQTGLGPKTASRTNAPSPTMSRVGFEVVEAQIDIDYLLVIQSP